MAIVFEGVIDLLISVCSGKTLGETDTTIG